MSDVALRQCVTLHEWYCKCMDAHACIHARKDTSVDPTNGVLSLIDDSEHIHRAVSLTARYTHSTSGVLSPIVHHTHSASNDNGVLSFIAHPWCADIHSIVHHTHGKSIHNRVLSLGAHPWCVVIHSTSHS